MAKPGGDDRELQRACEAAIEGTKQKVFMSIRVFKSRGVYGKSNNLKLGGRHQMAEPRVLAVCLKQKERKTKAFLRVLKSSSGGALESTKVYKLKHLTKVEVAANDPGGRTFTLKFDNKIKRSRNAAVAPPQWTMRSIDDRNRFLLCILRICKDKVGNVPKVVGVDVVEMALWAKENTPAMADQTDGEDGAIDSLVNETDVEVSVEKELVSQDEEEDMEALLGTYVMGIGEAEAFSERLKREFLALEAANVHAILETEPLIEEVLHGLDTALTCVDDMDEWLAIFNVKLRHMREDIEAIEIRNNKLQTQSVNNTSLIDELDKLVGRFSTPSEYVVCLTGGSFDEANMIKSVEWLANAYRGFEPPNLDPAYSYMKAIKEKRTELEKLKTSFVRRASDFLKNYFANLVDFMINDKSYISQRGQLKRPNHGDLHNKCKIYASLLQHLKTLGKNCMIPMRKAYCGSLNLLLRREAREFVNELRASTKVSKNHVAWLEASSQSISNPDTTVVSDTYDMLLTIFIPLLVDESSFFAHLMCFEVPTLNPSGGDSNEKTPPNTDEADDDLGIMDIDENDSKSSENNLELAALNECLRELLDGIQEDFYTIVDWAHKTDPLRGIAMHGVTERYLSNQKGDAASFVRILLGDLESRISSQFSRFVDEACHQIEKSEKNVKPVGVLPYIPRFAALATCMEEYISGQSRNLVDLAYTKIVSTIFATMEKISQAADAKYADIFLLENYAAFQNSLYDLANAVSTLAKFYHQASEGYEQASSRHISMIIYYQFEKLFQFARRVEDLMFTTNPEEIPYQMGLSKTDLRKVVKSSLSGVEKSIAAMYKKLQKNLTSEELLPSLWDKCKKQFLEKYESFVQLVAKVYPGENVTSLAEMRELLSSM